MSEENNNQEDHLPAPGEDIDHDYWKKVGEINQGAVPIYSFSTNQSPTERTLKDINKSLQQLIKAVKEGNRKK